MTNSFDLELVLETPSRSILTGDISDNVWKRIINEDRWNLQVFTWLYFLRSRQNIFCHDIVRNANLISMSIKFTDDLTILDLNKAWRGKSNVTDVISFPAIQENDNFPEGPFVEVGDIVVSLQVAERQAIEQNHTLDMEICWLVSHGLLHLLGWEHSTHKDLSEMLKLQDELLNIQLKF